MSAIRDDAIRNSTEVELSWIIYSLKLFVLKRTTFTDVEKRGVDEERCDKRRNEILKRNYQEIKGNSSYLF